MKKIIITLIVIIILAIAGIFVAGRFLGITFFQSIPVLNKINCAYPVAVSGDSMSPALKPGSRVLFNQCIENRENLPNGTVILYKENNTAKISRIKGAVLEGTKVSYLVGRDNREGETMEIAADRIIATWK